MTRSKFDALQEQLPDASPAEIAETLQVVRSMKLRMALGRKDEPIDDTVGAQCCLTTVRRPIRWLDFAVGRPTPGMRKSVTLCPRFTLSASQRGIRPRPDQDPELARRGLLDGRASAQPRRGPARLAGIGPSPGLNPDAGAGRR